MPDPPLQATPITLRISGEIDVATCSAMQGTIVLALKTGHPDVLVDMSRVTFIDAAGINALVAAAREASDGGGSLTLRAPSAPLLWLIGLLNLQDTLPVAPH